MTKIIQFKNETQQEVHECPTCNLVWEFLEYAKEADTQEELFEILSGLANEAKDLGIKEFLVHDIDNKVQILRHLDNGHCDCEECCDDCDC